MTLQVLTIALQCAAVAAFLALWYFWVKGKLGTSFFLDEDDQILFPFRYFSWILLGLIVATSVAQIHFVRVSATVHERLAGVTTVFQRQEQQTRALENLKDTIQRVRKDVDVNFQGLRSQLSEMRSRSSAAQQVSEAQSGPGGPMRRPFLAGLTPAKEEVQEGNFSEEAKAAPPPLRPRTVKQSAPAEAEPLDTALSMRVSRQGRILTKNLRVRKQPHLGAEVVERLTAGQMVKVTEKRLSTNQLWFRVVTPTGRAGWVDYRYIKLEGNS